MLFQEFFKVIFHYTGNLSCSLGDVSSIFSGFEIFVSVLQKNGAMRIFRDLGVCFSLSSCSRRFGRGTFVGKFFSELQVSKQQCQLRGKQFSAYCRTKNTTLFFLLPKVLAKLNGKVTFFLRPWLRRQTQLCE